MSDSEKTDELDSYGVWVKKGPADSSDDSALTGTEFDMDANLPDFSSLDAPEDTASSGADDSLDVTDAFLSDLNTDLSDLTGDAGAESGETESDGGTEDISLDEFIAGGEFEDVAEGNRGYGQAEAPAPEKSASSDGEESVSLDDFLDMDSFGDAPATESAPAATTSADDAPLDIDLSFDDNADSYATATVDADVAVAEAPAKEETGALAGSETIDLSEFGFGDDAADSTPAPESEPLEVSVDTPADAPADNFDDMFDNITDGASVDASAFFDEPAESASAESTEAAPAPQAEPAAASGGEEEVDLSDFGFDDASTENQGEVKDETKKVGSGKVDYEMTVVADDDDVQDSPAPAAVTRSAPEPAVSTDSGAEDSDFDLDSLMNNITDENGETVQLGDAPATPTAADAPIAETPVSETTVSETTISDAPLAETPIADDTFTVEETPVAEISSAETAVAEDTFSVTEAQASEPSAEEAFTVAETPAATEAPIAAEPSAEVSPQPVRAAPADTVESPAAAAILSQIVGELASLKNEIAGLKNDFEQMRNRETLAPAQEPDLAIPAVQESESAGGFFDDNGEDETIALSTDELSNVLNNADFETETVEAESDATETASFSEEPIAEASAAEPALDRAIPEPVAEEIPADNAGEENTGEEPLIDIPAVQENEAASGFFDDTAADETVGLSTDELSNVLNNADFATETVEAESDATETASFSAEPALTEEAAVADTPSEDTITFDEPSAESESPALDRAIPEPVAEEIPADTAGEESAGEEPLIDIPEIQPTETANGFFDDTGEDETIALSTDELSNILNNADFETETVEAESGATETPADSADAPVTEAEPPEAAVSEGSTLEEDAGTEEVADAPVSDDFGFDAIESEDSTARALPEEISVPKTEEPAEAPVSFDDEPATEPVSFDDEPVAETVSLDDEPTTEPVSLDEPTPTASAPDTALSGDLKQEIKSVLSYMDQLLENLPEEKIAEFAQSEQFETYKKLFKELGLA